MNVLITGGAGFVGYHLARYHVERGDTVAIVDNLFKTGGKEDEAFRVLVETPGVEHVRADLTCPVTTLTSFPHLDVVYHLAAINGTQLFYEMPYQVARANLLMTLNLLNGIEGKAVGKLVYASSSEVYAGCEGVGLLDIPTDEQVPVVFSQPTNARFSYGTSKFMGEFLCLYFGRQFGVPCSIVRYHNVYGPRMGTRHVVPEFIVRIRARENPFRIFGGDETRAFCYVDDAVRATHLVAGSAVCSNEIIHIGNPNEEINIAELARLMMRQFGVELELKECGRRPGSVSRRCPDISKLKKLTGFEPEVDLNRGLSRTMEWYLENSP